MSDYKKTNDLTEKTTPVDADLLRLDDSADSFAWKKATIANVSSKIQADLMSNDAVTTIASTDTIPLLASGENKIISEANLSAQVQADIIADDNTFTGTNVFPNLNVGSGNTRSGTNATAEGKSTTASGYVSHAQGYYSLARLRSQHAQANGRFAATGDSQRTSSISHKETTDATPIECLTSTSERYVLPAGYIMACTVTINGSNADGSVAGFYKRQAYIKNVAGAVALIGSVQTIGTDIEIGAIGGVAVTADDTNDSLLVTVTGKADETIRWVCVIDAVEVGH